MPGCEGERESLIEYFRAFADGFEDTLDASRNEYTKAKGLSIHKSCYKNFKGEFFNELAYGALEKGLACAGELAQRAQNQRRPAEVFTLLRKFKAHLEQEESTIGVACGDDSVSWENVRALASFEEQEDFGKYGLDHPFILLNPSMKKGWFNTIKDDKGKLKKREVQGILFHEMTHNMGYDHGAGLDLGYGCETCCFQEGLNADSPACRVCEGSYRGELDPSYIRDLALMEGKSDTFALLQLLAKHKDKVKWNDKNLASLLTYYQAKDPAFAKALAARLNDRFSDASMATEWKEKLKREGDGFDDLDEFRMASAKFFVSAVIEGNQEQAAEDFLHMDFLSLNSKSLGSGTLNSVFKNKVEKSFQTVEALCLALKDRVENRMLRMRLHLFLHGR